MSQRGPTDSSPKAGPFATTQWSLVEKAGRDPSPQSRAALASLCESYWYPLYAYVRRKGYQSAEAQDLTQGFFAELLEKDRLRLADQHRGKFRSFLLASLNHFVANRWRAAQAQKRGGGTAPLSLDFAKAESRYELEPSHDMTPERAFERRWAMTLLGNALNKLRDEYAATDKLVLFDHLKEHLAGAQESAPHKTVADQLEMSPGAVKVAVYRMRQRCRELLREEIAETVSRVDEIDDELRSLFAVFDA